MQNNKTETIDVSNYSEPIEIEPDSGYDGMKKATVTLSNIPSGGTNILYCWFTNGLCYTTTENPSVGDYAFSSSDEGIMTYEILDVGDGYISIAEDMEEARNSEGDINLNAQ